MSSPLLSTGSTEAFSCSSSEHSLSYFSLLWKTTMVTDDPKHRDLNQFVDKLLAAGSNFFDQEIEKDEAFVRTDLPEGYVNIGDAKVMPDHQER